MAIFHLKKNGREIAFTDAEDALAAKKKLIGTNPEVPERMTINGLIATVDGKIWEIDKEEGDTWQCYTLCMDDIKAVADRKGLSFEEIDFEDVVHYIKKGIEWALDNRDEIIETAIKQARSIEKD